MAPAVAAAYTELISHSPGCARCCALRDEDGKSLGQCSTADDLTDAYRRARRQVLKEAR